MQVDAIKGDEFKTLCRYDFANRVYLDHNNNHTEAESLAEFRLLYDTWWSMRQDAYKKMYEGKLTEYNPIENYDRLEEGGWLDTRTDNLKEKRDNGKRENTSTSKPNVIIETANYVAGDDSSEAVLASKSVVSPNSTTADTITAEEAASVDELTNTGTQSNKREFEGYRVHGNIGVTTSSALLKEYLEVQGALDLRRQAIEEFIDLYTIYV